MEKWAPGITAIMQADLGATPASINRETGVMFVNPKYKLSSDQWYFIMLHELGHLKKQTKNELEADRWAHEQYLKEGRSLKASVYALTDLLNYNKPEDMARAQAQLRRAQMKDGKNVNFAGSIPCYKSEYQNQWLPYGFSPYDSRYNEYFLGGVGDWLSKNASAIGSAVGGFVATKKSTNAASGSSATSQAAALEAERLRIEAEQKAKAQRTTMIIGAAIGVLVLVGVVIFIIKRKK